jgi:hypothetical protein
MNHYFRLLFVSFFLLLLMGLNESQSDDCGSSMPVEVNISQLAVHAGILPAEEWITSEPILPEVYCMQALQYKENNEQWESTNSIAVQTKMICCTVEFMETRPGIAWKTGQFIHFKASKGDPSHS